VWPVFITIAVSSLSVTSRRRALATELIYSSLPLAASAPLQPPIASANASRLKCNYKIKTASEAEARVALVAALGLHGVGGANYHWQFAHNSRGYAEVDFTSNAAAVTAQTSLAASPFFSSVSLRDKPAEAASAAAGSSGVRGRHPGPPSASQAGLSLMHPPVWGFECVRTSIFSLLTVMSSRVWVFVSIL
jgi:hypothetical protein